MKNKSRCLEDEKVSSGFIGDKLGNIWIGFKKKNKLATKNSENIEQTKKILNIEKQGSKKKNKGKIEKQVEQKIEKESELSQLNEVNASQETKKVVTKKSKENYSSFITLLESKDETKLINFLERLAEKDIILMLKANSSMKIGFKTSDMSTILSRAKSKTELIDLVKEGILNNLKEKLDEIKSQISELRKKGLDVKEEELIVLKVPPKIRIFESTFDKKDLEQTKKILNNLEESLKEKRKNKGD